ncbi:olfactory receptor class A-like protein 1 [Latimeria chalumnae]|uniref:olfactory receptor class A-like protein 1 n=1 Tax=Latimeria chalumnae TaxID=7897 RepID=UPI0006D92A06|nr:PREDICTED: vomeronasal type-1 receptor 90-like [Latimeria chalumnae]|eukprot:XP_014339607.1 PREDICTED: vomeronasal type-1 receptor 90-like [Latimeria chalumnae]
MDPEIVNGAVHFVISIIGIAGNIVILASFSHITYHKRKIMAVEKILVNLSGANLIILVSRGLPLSLYAFGLRNLFNDFCCQFIGYVHITFRALSVALTCLLSCFQSIMLAKNSPKTAKLKLKLQTHIVPILSLLCIFSMLCSVDVIVFSVSSYNVTVPQYTAAMGYCLVVFPNIVTFHLVGYGIFTRDFLFVFLMALASSYILLVLYRHGKQVQGIRSMERNHESTAEGQAAKTVVTLVSFYVTLFGIDNTIWFYQIISKGLISKVFDIRTLISILYAVVFPFVIIAFNKKIRSKLKCFTSEQKSEISIIEEMKHIQG